MALRSVRIAVVAGALVLGSLASAGPVLAASPSQLQCEQTQGAVYDGQGGTKTCTNPATAPGNSPTDGGSASQTTTTGQGNLGNKPASYCDGNHGQCK
jgi:hypothetical protein